MFFTTLTARRRLFFALALAWFVFALIFSVYRQRSGAALPFLHWPFAATLAWTLASALACGVVVAECLRSMGRRQVPWTARRHLWTALLLALTCFVVQWLSLAAAA
jgi:hypothetical protein